MRQHFLGRLIGVFLLAAGTAAAQPAAEPTPEQVRSLLQLLADPVVKSWIERETQAPAAEPAATAPPPSLETEAVTFL
jgi:hypothetical protein